MTGTGRPPALVAVDWGTSSARAYLMSGEDVVVGSRSAPVGVSRAAGGPGSDERRAWFAAAFDDLCGGWLADQPSLPVLACGMVGSAQGWVEAPYRPLPADLTDLSAADLTTVRAGGGEVHIVSGLVKSDGLAGVMRGEETQVLAVLGSPEAYDVVLPGTHSKWVRAEGSVVGDFTTFLTGEVFALLAGDSILAALAEPPVSPAWDAFDRGVRVAAGPEGRTGPLGTVFSARALVLTGSLQGREVLDYLSGLLVGAELVAARDHWLQGPPRPLLCVGDADLSARYCRAARLVGWPDAAVHPDAAPTGLWRTAVAAGLVPVPHAPAATPHDADGDET
jgi:2-dehydro-3-deoxygalactonokinase